MASRGVRAAVLCGQRLHTTELFAPTPAAAHLPRLFTPSSRLLATSSRLYEPLTPASAVSTRLKSTSSVRAASASHAVKPVEAAEEKAAYSPRADAKAETSALFDADNHLKLSSEEKANILKRFYKMEIPQFVADNPYNTDYLPQLNVKKFKDMDPAKFELYSFKRKVHKTNITKSIILHTPEVEGLSQHDKRPLVLMFPWLMADARAVAKYVSLHSNLGLSVLQVNISPVDLLLPMTKAQPMIYQVLDFLAERREFERILMHGLSVGGYGFQEMLVQIQKSGARYLGVKDRVVGQVYDSPCELQGLREGVARSVVRGRRRQQQVMRFLDWLLEQRYDSASRHYVACQRICDTNYMQAPALFLYSKLDQVAEAKITSKTAYLWHNNGTQVFSHIFEDSEHVGHLRKYRDDYQANLFAFMERVGVVSFPGL